MNEHDTDKLIEGITVIAKELTKLRELCESIQFVPVKQNVEAVSILNEEKPKGKEGLLTIVDEASYIPEEVWDNMEIKNSSHIVTNWTDANCPYVKQSSKKGTICIINGVECHMNAVFDICGLYKGIHKKNDNKVKDAEQAVLGRYSDKEGKETRKEILERKFASGGVSKNEPFGFIEYIEYKGCTGFKYPDECEYNGKYDKDNEDCKECYKVYVRQI